MYAGHHHLTLKISDSQGHNSLQNLTVTVCDCTESPDCHSRSASSQLGGNAIGIIILGLLLLLGEVTQRKTNPIYSLLYVEYTGFNAPMKVRQRTMNLDRQ